MKKVLVLLLLIFLTGCNKEIIKTCTIKSDEFEQKWEFISKEDEVSKINLNIKYSNSLFKIDDLDQLTTSEKLILEREILSELGLLEEKYEGLEIDVLIEKELSIKINVDLSKVDKDVLNKLGINFDSYKTTEILKNMEHSGAKCD